MIYWGLPEQNLGLKQAGGCEDACLVPHLNNEQVDYVFLIQINLWIFHDGDVVVNVIFSWRKSN